MALHDAHPLDPNTEAAAGAASKASRTFGHYLLFKRLKRDGLGEVHRAGQLGANAVERVVSLRLFNGPGIQGDRFRQACRDREALASALAGGPFGSTVDLGVHGDVAYWAQEFVFGRSLAEMLAQAREQSYPVPLEHTLHIMDRLAIAVQNAHETRIDERRIIHGFLIPDFVHLSSEGEIRLSGFEPSGGMLDLDANGPARAELAGYISPEVQAGQPPKANDDIYSLGSIFGELLTGEPLPALNPAETSRWAEAAMLAEEAAPLPGDIRSLLRESLLPRGQRIQSAEQWHKALAEIISSGGHTPTTFNLAFFMHTLFGDELDREVALVEVERRTELPPPSPEPVPTPDASEPEPAADVEAVVPASPEVDATAILRPAATPKTESRTQAAAASRGSRRWIAVAAGVVLVAGLAAAVFIFDLPIPGMSPKGEPIEVAAAPRVEESAFEPAAGTAADGTVTGISALAPPLAPEELEAQVRTLVAQRAGDLEANLKAEYDQRLVELRQQLEQARQVPQATPEPTQTVPESPAPAGQAPIEVAERPRQAAEPTPQRSVARTRTPAEQPAVAAPQAQARVIEPEPVPEPVRQAAQPSPPATKPAVEPAVEPETVAAGTIVSPGPGVTAPTLVRQPNAVYPPAARRLRRQATVRVRLLVDESGKPIEIEQVSKTVGLGFDRAALQAAKTTRWTPPMKNGVQVKMWVELSIDFRP